MAEFQADERIIYTGGWGTTEFRLPGILEQQVYRACDSGHETCSVKAHEIWLAKLDTGAWAEGYPEQFEKENA